MGHSFVPRIESCMTQDAPTPVAEAGRGRVTVRKLCGRERCRRQRSCTVAGMLHPPRASHLTGDKRQEEVHDCGQRHKTDGVPGGRASPTRLFILSQTRGGTRATGCQATPLTRRLTPLAKKMYHLMNESCPGRSPAPADGSRPTREAGNIYSRDVFRCWAGHHTGPLGWVQCFG